MKKLRKFFLSMISTVVAFFAYTEVSTACMILFYQPKTPQELQK